MMNFKIGCMLIGRMMWNVLCFDFTSVQYYALLAFIHFFAEKVDDDDPGD